ncbi:hypothetical protein M9Y10_045567 [Tritrichomonas musculus]|uniref:Beta-lactamase n=1 Tax=Tritrichomonas musculus TaxID=1915356 RepID=A0ABR2JWV2_9EUKA
MLMLYNALQNKEEASKYFKKAADKGNVESMLKYSHALNNADGIDSNKDEAVTCIKMAFDKDDPEAFSIYGHLLQSGELFITKKSADQGNLNGINNYFSLIKSNAANYDKSGKLFYYKLAADRENVDANCSYADLIFDEDKKPAFECYEKAANYKDACGLYKYGLMLYNGDIDTKKINKEEAIKYIKNAADKGRVEAMIFSW